MQGEAPPTAILCGNDVLAVGALRQAQEMALDVPGDVSITGFDDIELARIVSPRADNCPMFLIAKWGAKQPCN